jgi:hypothetical protein
MRTSRLSATWLRVSATAVAALFIISCRQGDVEWPAAGPDDLNDVVYVTRLAEGGAEIIGVSAAGGVDELGLRCDGQSDVAVSPDGRRLYFGRDSALHEYEPATAVDRVVASFKAGVAREAGTDDEGRAVTFAWRCGVRFRDVHFSPRGGVAFVVEPTECPVAREYAAAVGKGELEPRTDFAVDAGAYLLEPGSDAPRYLGPTRAVYGFAGDGALLLENKLTVARYDLDEGTVRPVLGAGAHELGWLPSAAARGDDVVVVATKADEKSHEVVFNRIFVIRDGRGGDEPVVELEGKTPATRAAFSPDGRYVAVQCTPQVFGEPTVYAVDLERKRCKILVNGANLVGFTRGSRGVFYVVASGRKGDLFLAGLDGAARRLTSSGDVLLPP